MWHDHPLFIDVHKTLLKQSNMRYETNIPGDISFFSSCKKVVNPGASETLFLHNRKMQSPIEKIKLDY